VAGCGGGGGEATTAPPTSASVDIGEPATSDTPEAAAGEPSDLGGRTVAIGTDASYPPFESMSESGEVVGIDPDLMAAICEKVNCVPQFENTAWDGIFAALKAGEFDALMSAITIQPEREANSGAKFTEPYFRVGQVMLVKSDNTEINAPSDLATSGVTVGVQTGTTGDIASGELGVPDASMSRFDTIVLAVEALLNGDVDVVVLDNPTAEVYMTQHPDELRISGAPFTTEDYGILVPEGDVEMLNAFNQAIVELAADGTIDEIVATWFAETSAAP
jgi:polar amino acid transport system substrate-binding protein